MMEFQNSGRRTYEVEGNRTSVVQYFARAPAILVS
jgi:hypothetical protein